MSYQENRIFTLNEPNAPRLNPSLACEIGLNESLLLLQIEFFISVSGIEKDGQKWIFNSTRDIKNKWFPFWSHHTINRAINSLESSNYITTTTKYNKAKYDKTRWFTLNYQGLSSLKSIMVNVNATRSVQNETGSVQNETRSTQNETTIQEIKKEIKKNTTTTDSEILPSVDPLPKEKQPSSSFSKSELISLLATLMALVPEQHQKPSVEKTIERGLKAHTDDYIRAAIAYTIAYSNGGTWQKFKAYLGKCIDLGWADGWEPDQVPQIDKKAIQEKFRKMPDNDLNAFAETGNVWAIEELERRKL